MKCPECQGHKVVTVLVCPPGEFREIVCTLCEGSGEISAVQQRWIAEGQAMRQSRLNRGLSLSEEAKRIGVTPYVLSQRERGKIIGRPTSRAADAGEDAAIIGAEEWDDDLEDDV